MYIAANTFIDVPIHTPSNIVYGSYLMSENDATDAVGLMGGGSYPLSLYFWYEFAGGSFGGPASHKVGGQTGCKCGRGMQYGCL